MRETVIVCATAILAATGLTLVAKQLRAPGDSLSPDEKRDRKIERIERKLYALEQKCELSLERRLDQLEENLGIYHDALERDFRKLENKVNKKSA